MKWIAGQKLTSWSQAFRQICALLLAGIGLFQTPSALGCRSGWAEGA
jgi:hypothetical protein